MTKKIKCNCENEYQDKKYGPGIRVHNQTEKNDKKVYRCTVCCAER